MANEFPAIWFDTFLNPANTAPVDRELDFVRSYLPVSKYPGMLDVACGIGRHAGPLAALGYEVLGIDRSETALGIARRQYPDVAFRKLDIFELGSMTQTFDGVLSLWQSFGYGDSEQNRRVLLDIQHILRPGGRMVLDIYNADAVTLLPSRSTEERSGRTVRTRRTLAGRRCHVELEYSDSNETDRHEWEIYSRSEIEQLAIEVGLEVLVSCAWFNPALPPSKDHLRMQFLCERPA